MATKVVFENMTKRAVLELLDSGEIEGIYVYSPLTDYHQYNFKISEATLREALRTIDDKEPTTAIQVDNRLYVG